MIGFENNRALFQEFHKSIVGLGAIIFALSPAFYIFTYSSPQISSKLIEKGYKPYVDQYFKYSMGSTIGLIVMSIFGIILSYLSFKGIIISYANQAVISISASLVFLSLRWSYLFGVTVYVAIVNYIK